MNYLHNKTPKILHLDLKPSNIMVFRDYKVKIGDLGLAAVVQDGNGVAAKAENTPPYASPEAILVGRAGAPQMTTKSDVFSYGVLLYEMIFQEPMVPFQAELEQCQDPRAVRVVTGKCPACVQHGAVTPHTLASVGTHTQRSTHHVCVHLQCMHRHCTMFICTMFMCHATTGRANHAAAHHVPH
jgi:hypothetical protein